MVKLMRYFPFWDDPVLLRRGKRWPPSAVDPNKGVIYVCAGDRQAAYTTNADTDSAEPGDRYTGGNMRFAHCGHWNCRGLDRGQQTSVVTAMAGTLLQWTGRNRRGICCSQDAMTGGLPPWMPRPADSGAMTDAGVNAPPTVFEHNGNQYVTVLSAGNLLAGSARGDSIWMFKLLDEGEETAIALEKVTPPQANTEGLVCIEAPASSAMDSGRGGS